LFASLSAPSSFSFGLYAAVFGFVQHFRVLITLKPQTFTGYRIGGIVVVVKDHSKSSCFPATSCLQTLLAIVWSDNLASRK